MLRCTREWVRVLKPSGSIFVDLGDKFDSGTTTARVNPGTVKDGQGQGWHQGTPRVSTGRPKSLLLLPERYRIACADELGLIVREVIEWHKPNPIPDSAKDRCGRTHEDVVHFVKQPRYYSALDEIRELQDSIGERHGGNRSGYARATPDIARHFSERALHPLGKIPGSVWTIQSQPLLMPAHLAGDEHFAAFPMELPRRIILGWSPSGICLECGEGRWPVVDRERTLEPGRRRLGLGATHARSRVGPQTGGPGEASSLHHLNTYMVTGYACACTRYTDHPGTGGGGWGSYDNAGMSGAPAANGKQHVPGNYKPKTGPWREYHLDGWTPPPTRPAVVVDPFGGTGTTSLVADVLGRTGITVDRSADYCRLARWRTRDPAERARALGVPKPPPVPEGQRSLFDDLEDAG